MKKTLICALFLLVVLGCEKNNEVEELFYTSPALAECYSNTIFDCDGTLGEEYFSCQLDGKDFCRSAGSNDYISYYRPTLIVITNGPTLELSQVIGRYCLEFGIRHAEEVKDEEPKLLFNYLSPTPATPREMLDNAFKVGPLRLRDRYNPADTADVFDLRVAFRCKNGTIDSGFESGFGAQRNPYLECTRYERFEVDDVIMYDITLKFECDLWRGDHPDTQKLWRRLENGVLAMRFMVNK